jgi:hypothetical protein
VSCSKVSSTERQRLRDEARHAIAGVSIPLALEAIAGRLDVNDGRFAARFQTGYLQHVTRTRSLDLDRLPYADLSGVSNLLDLVEALGCACGVRNGTLVLDFEAHNKLSAVLIKDAFSASALVGRVLEPSRRMGLPPDEW